MRIWKGVTSSNATWVESSPGTELWPGDMSVMSSNFSNLFFVALDAPESSYVISVDETLLLLVAFSKSVTQGEGAQKQLLRDIHR